VGRRETAEAVSLFLWKCRRVIVSVGTCGFSYKDWIGDFYPAGVKASAMLPLYAKRFPIVEIDSTYYGVPSEAAVESWNRRTPAGFRFTAKLPAAGTHPPTAGVGVLHDDVRAFRANLAPLVREKKLACALMQFPNSFRPGAEAERHLRMLCDVLDGMTLVAEFRHRDWQTNDTLQLLRSLGVGLVSVDEPELDTLLRPSTDITSNVAYVRFHGRNAKQWWKGDNVTRYDYDYSAEELGPWADRLIDTASNPQVTEVLAFFNNHRRGQAARNAEMFVQMLAERFPDEEVAKPDHSATPEDEENPLLGLFE
jgi:uncharacterized protein YecE (DUF72 family)